MSITTKRISAYLLDIFFIYLLLSLITNIKFINPTYDKYMEYYDKYTEVVNKYYDEEITIEEMQELNKDNYYNVVKYGISSNVSIVLVIVLYFGVFQKYNNDQTLGKRIMKLKVMSTNGEDISLCRYLLRLLPMYFIFIGGILPIIINSILVFILNSNSYGGISSIITYLFIGIGILDITMNLHNKIAHTNVELINK